MSKHEDSKLKTSFPLSEKMYQNRKISLTFPSTCKLEFTPESSGSYISLQLLNCAHNHGGNVLLFSTVSCTFSLAESEKRVRIEAEWQAASETPWCHALSFSAIHSITFCHRGSFSTDVLSFFISAFCNMFL